MRIQNRRPPTKVSKHFNKLIVDKLVKQKDLINHKLYIKALIENDKEKAWPSDDRNYVDYSLKFNHGIKKHGLGESFIDFLKRRNQETKESVSVLDLGYGKGNFLTDIKKMLKDSKIPNKVDGISLVDNSTEENKKYIDRKTNVPATEHIINKKYDLIVDMWGVFSYSFNNIRKELMLKYAYTLKKGGVLILNVEYFKGSPKLQFIINHLKKQGFKAGFYEFDENPMNQHKYNTLIIERIK